MPFSDAMVQRIWEKASVVEGNDPNVYRKDQCGAWILRSAYGDRNSQYGWEVDHITPQSQGGGDDLANLRPLHWENNADRATGRLNCPVTSSGINNVRH